LTAEEKKFVPQTPRGLSPRLLELAPILRSRGIVCERSKTPLHGYQLITITRIKADAENPFAFLDE
jgi:hypothetical protein